LPVEIDTYAAFTKRQKKLAFERYLKSGSGGACPSGQANRRFFHSAPYLYY